MSEKRYEVESYFTKDNRWGYLAFVVDNENADNENCFLNLNDVVDLLNSLSEENEQLKYDNTMFKQVIKHFQKVAQTDKRRLEEENEQLRQQLDYIQNLISEKIKHQKTELQVKALQEVIKDYNEYVLGHKNEWGVK